LRKIAKGDKEGDKAGAVVMVSLLRLNQPVP
jgi:hypothetical protein